MAALRRATADDAGAVARLFRASRAAALPFLPVLHTPAQDLAFFGHVIATQAVTLAQDDAGLAGFVARAGEWIHHLYLRPDMRRRGLGTRLLGHAGAGAPLLRLHCFAANAPALAFYARHGFAAVAHGDGSANEEGMPDVLLERRLQPPTGETG